MRFTPRTAILLALVSAAGLMMFAWPLVLHGYDRVQPPFVFLALLPLMLAVLLSEIAAGGIDTRTIAMLGVLSAVEAVLRAVSAGTGGVELVFFMLILGGRVFGPAFGFVLGCASLFVAALVTAGVGPWLPYQMLGAAWVAAGAGLLPRARARAETGMLAAYGILASYAYGLLLNLQGWPLLTGVDVPGASGSLSYDPAAGTMENLATFLRYTLVTSTSSWDTVRALTTAVALVLLGPAVLATLRRAARRATVTGAVVSTSSTTGQRPA